MRKEGYYRLSRRERNLLRGARRPIVTDEGKRITKPCVLVLDKNDMGVICCFTVKKWRKLLRTLQGFETAYVFELVNIS